jgi:hypothetical protein
MSSTIKPNMSRECERTKSNMGRGGEAAGKLPQLKRGRARKARILGAAPQRLARVWVVGADGFEPPTYAL